MLLTQRFPTYFLYLIVINMAICPSFLKWESSFNGLLLLLMCIMPIIVIFSLMRDFKLYRYEFLLLFFIVTVFIFPVLFHSESLRWSTIFYSAMYCITFMAYVRVLNKSGINILQYLKLIKFLIYAYFIVLLIQQFCVLTGLPVFLVNQYNPAEPWKLNSLSLEPSHTARFVPLFMYSFITIKEVILNRRYSLKEDFKTDKYIWIAFLYTMVTMGSGTAFLFIPIVLLKFIRGKDIVVLVALTLVLWFAMQQISPQTMKRTTDTFFATLTLDENKIIKADGSAALRIVPMMVVMKNIGLITFDNWFGHGIDSTKFILNKQMRIPGQLDDSVGGALFQLWYEYGFISFLLFILFSFLTCYKKGDFLSVVFWFFLVFMYGVNNQMVWMCVVLLYANKVFTNVKLIIL